MAETYSPPFSKQKAALERHITVDSINRFHKKKDGNIARLKSKDMGRRVGVEPSEEVFSLTMVDPGAVRQIDSGDDNLQAETMLGVDALGNEVEIDTLGSDKANALCKDTWGGSFGVGKDSYKPTFYVKDIRFPVFCVDELADSTTEARSIMRTIHDQAGDLAINMLDYNLHELILERQLGNTSIANEVKFSSDLDNVPANAFPYEPQSYLNHEFMKRIHEITMRDPANHGKKFYVEASSFQIEAAIEADQRQRGIERRSLEKVTDPFRVGEEMFEYDGITYVKRKYADYVGGVDLGGDRGIAFVRPFDYVHQAGNTYGVVARANYSLEQGDFISVGNNRYRKYEIAHWYYEEAVKFVPYIGNKDFPTSGDEKIKNFQYSSPAAFKPYWVAPHAITDPDGSPIENSRNQFQQMALKTMFGLFHRPDIIQSGSVLMLPRHRNIQLETPITGPDGRAVPDVNPISEDREAVLYTDRETVTAGSIEADGGGLELSEIPGPTLPFPPLAEDVPGQFRVGGSGAEAETTEEFNDAVDITFLRVDGSQGAATLDIATQDGTATAGQNYTATTATLSWADGETGPKTVTVPLLDDDIATAVEFTVVASNATGATAPDQDTVTVTINPKPSN